MLAALADPQDERHEDLKEWVGDLNVDPEHFDMDEVNKQLRKLFRPKQR